MIIAASFDTQNQDLWNNRALQYGDGLFETMLLKFGHIPLWPLHMRRLQKGLKKLQLTVIDEQLLLRKIEIFCKSGLKPSGIIKILVFRANQARTYQPKSQQHEWVISINEYNSKQSVKPLDLGVAKARLSIQKMLAGVKHLSRLEQVMIAAELNRMPHVEDILALNTKGEIIETSCQNVVLLQGEQFFTPKLKDSGVKGVALAWLKLNYSVQTRHIKLKHLKAYDGMMVCNSIRGFRLVSKIKKTTSKDLISFSTSHPIHDKIVSQWDALFNS